MKPRYPYENATGYIHIRDHDELSASAKRTGAMTKNRFIEYYNIKPSSSWENNYIRYQKKRFGKYR